MPAQNLTQEQVQRQVQRLTPQQFLVSQLLEMPLTELEQRVRDELYDNVALEEGRDEADCANEDNPDNPADDPLDDPAAEGNTNTDIEETGAEDDLPVYTPKANADNDNDLPIGDTRSFIDELTAQIAEYDVNARQRAIIEYLIGSLDDRGFIDRPLASLSDDLLFTADIDVSVSELEEALATLQQFDPCGIGARDLRECLLLQIDRQMATLDDSEANPDRLREYTLWGMARKIIAEHFRLFERNEQERLVQQLGCTAEQLREVFARIARLNPHPGRSLHEAADDRAQTIVPDFFVETNREHGISLTLNTRGIPSLRVCEEYQRQMTACQSGTAQLSHAQREAYTFTRQRVQSARMFISAVRQRQQTLRSTMRAIIELQREFFLTQDDATLRQLRLVDVAERTGLDISTVSRVVNSKYVALDGTLYPLKHFFLRTKQGAQGEQVMRNKVQALLRELIDTEDKHAPLSDEQLTQLLSSRGEVVSRRTVAKYRNAMKIPTANLRKTL